MSARSEIVLKIQEVYGDEMPNVYNGTDYDGSIQATGWWYRPFGRTPFYLGKSKQAALETLGQVATERADTRP